MKERPASPAGDDGAWELADDEFEATLALDASARYAYFARCVVAHGALWTLFRGEELVTAEGGAYVPIWPHPRFAAASTVDDWEDCEPERVDLDEWKSNWAPLFAEQGRRAFVFPRASDHGGCIETFEDVAARNGTHCRSW